MGRRQRHGGESEGGYHHGRSGRHRRVRYHDHQAREYTVDASIGELNSISQDTGLLISVAICSHMNVVSSLVPPPPPAR